MCTLVWRGVCHGDVVVVLTSLRTHVPPACAEEYLNLLKLIIHQAIACTYLARGGWVGRWSRMASSVRRSAAGWVAA